MKRLILSTFVTVCLALGGVAVFGEGVSANACPGCSFEYQNAVDNCRWQGMALAEFSCTYSDGVCDAWYTCQ